MLYNVLYNYLKSNMDRFIGKRIYDNSEVFNNLKSNMDRFIDISTKCNS